MCGRGGPPILTSMHLLFFLFAALRAGSAECLANLVKELLFFNCCSAVVVCNLFCKLCFAHAFCNSVLHSCFAFVFCNCVLQLCVAIVFCIRVLQLCVATSFCNTVLQMCWHLCFASPGSTNRGKAQEVLTAVKVRDIQTVAKSPRTPADVKSKKS